MEGMGVKLTSVVVRHLLGCPSMFGPIAGNSWTHMYSYSVVQTILTESLTHLRLPTLPLHCSPYPLPPAHPLICAPCDITMVVNKGAQNPAVLTEIYNYKTLAKRLFQLYSISDMATM